MAEDVIANRPIKGGPATPVYTINPLTLDTSAIATSIAAAIEVALAGEFTNATNPINLKPNPNELMHPLTVTNAADIAMTSLMHVDTTHYEITFEGGAVRYRTDGVAPTASVGHLVRAESNTIRPAAWVTDALFIATTSTNGTLYFSPLMPVS